MMMDDDVPVNLERDMNRFFEEQYEIIDNVVLRGACKDFAHYKELCGQRIGLRTAHQRLSEFIDNWNNRG